MQACQISEDQTCDSWEPLPNPLSHSYNFTLSPYICLSPTPEPHGFSVESMSIQLLCKENKQMKPPISWLDSIAAFAASLQLFCLHCDCKSVNGNEERRRPKPWLDSSAASAASLQFCLQLKMEMRKEKQRKALFLFLFFFSMIKPVIRTKQKKTWARSLPIHPLQSHFKFIIANTYSPYHNNRVILHNSSRYIANGPTQFVSAWTNLSMTSYNRNKNISR